MRYSEGFKARMVERMAGPEGISARTLSAEVGVCQPTLSRWLRAAAVTVGEEEKKVENPMPFANTTGTSPMRPEDRTAEEKLRLVQEAAKLSETELGAFLRQHGIHETHLEGWRRAIQAAALDALQKPKKGRKRPSPEAKRVRELERELLRKDKALAEVTALLALKKKLETLLEDEDESTPRRSGR